MGCLFEGRYHLFEGLYIHDKWDWQQQYPVVRLSFGSGVANSREDLDANIRYQLQQQRKKLNIETPPPERIADNFASLLENARSVHGQRMVVLIDKYDEPILDNLLNTERARELREGLKNLYSVLKDADPYLHFVLLTGVSKFSKVSLFSGLNNLNDITLVPLTPPFAATPITILIRYLPPSCQVLTVKRSAAGTTATAGAESTSILFITPLMYCCCYKNVSLGRTGLRAPRPPF